MIDIVVKYLPNSYSNEFSPQNKTSDYVDSLNYFMLALNSSEKDVDL